MAFSPAIPYKILILAVLNYVMDSAYTLCTLLSFTKWKSTLTAIPDSTSSLSVDFIDFQMFPPYIFFSIYTYIIPHSVVV